MADPGFFSNLGLKYTICGAIWALFPVLFSWFQCKWRPGWFELTAFTNFFTTRTRILDGGQSERGTMANPGPTLNPPLTVSNMSASNTQYSIIIIIIVSWYQLLCLSTVYHYVIIYCRQYRPVTGQSNINDAFTLELGSIELTTSSAGASCTSEHNYIPQIT